MRTVNLTIPRSWGELTAKQLVFISALFLVGLTKNVFLLKAFMFLANIKILPYRDGDEDNPVYMFKREKEDAFPLTQGEITDFSHRCEFLLQERVSFNPLPKLAGRKARDTMMFDATFGEFISAMVFYNQFQNPAADSQFLQKLCAVMYPAGEWDPDQVPFKEFEKIPLHICYTAYLWFGTVLNVIANECPNLFPKTAEDAEPVSLRDNIHAMYNLVTENDITKEKEISHIDMWRVLYDMDEKARRIREINEQLEKNGRV